jgi:hypothetical protein
MKTTPATKEPTMTETTARHAAGESTLTLAQLRAAREAAYARANAMLAAGSRQGWADWTAEAHRLADLCTARAMDEPHRAYREARAAN